VPLLSRAILNIAGACLALSVFAKSEAPSEDVPVSMKKGYGVTPTGLSPIYPAGYKCSPITSPYATWIDVDGSRRDEIHTGVDAGRLGEWILAPASGTVRAVWKADWKWGREGAILIKHDRRDVNLSDGPKFYYSEFDHVGFEEIERFKVGQHVERGERLARVTRPGDNVSYLPEVHWEVWEADNDDLSWRTNRYGAADWWNGSAALIDPLYMLGLNDPPADGKDVKITPFVKGTDYSRFRGFTYILPCVPK
jgi:murein DD-endopeptidase MepM/ murein hydrolase activator NlpD